VTKRIVILQPQYFPWGGVFEQIKMADIYVHYDDVQFQHGGGFTNRVQVKTAQGIVWMTVPVTGASFTSIKETPIDYKHKWRKKHLGLLSQSFARAPFKKDMMDIAEAVLAPEHPDVAELNIKGIEACANYLGMAPAFYRSSALGIGGSSTQRVVNICKHFGANVYITGLGARNYIDYNMFEEAGIRLEYMDYADVQRPQLHGDFTPYTAILDLIANCGKDGLKFLQSGSKYWRDILPLLEEKETPVPEERSCG